MPPASRNTKPAGPAAGTAARSETSDPAAPPGAAGSCAAAWQAFRAAHPEIRSLDLILPDLAGIARGKRIAATGEGWPAGEQRFATSLYAIDTTGANVDASGLIWEEGDADRPCRFDPASLAPVPWRPGGAQVLGGLCEPDGRPFFADPRALLARIAGRFAELGLRPVAALELEYYLVPEGRYVGRDGGRPGGRDDALLAEPGAQDSIDVYSLDQLDDHDVFLAHLGRIATAQGLPIKSSVSEYAPGQFESNLGHVEGALAAADHAFLLKRAIKAAARLCGRQATFMAKPFANQAASGLHVHLSLLDAAGANRLAAAEPALRHAVAGLQATMAEAMLLWAPNANSYRRLRPWSYAPLAPSWGYNNRTVALRIPDGPAAARRIEHRVAGADANPYLVLAAVLAGVHHGLSHALEPTPPTAGNAYEQTPPSLPTSWERALAAFAAAEVLPAYLGADFARLYHVCRSAERERFDDVITPTEYAWYLRSV